MFHIYWLYLNTSWKIEVEHLAVDTSNNIANVSHIIMIMIIYKFLRRVLNNSEYFVEKY